MRVHNGMRPHDVVILLKIIALKDKSWQYRDLSASLNISISEISASLVRSSEVELIDSNRKKKVSRNNLMDFIQFGIPALQLRTHILFMRHAFPVVNLMFGHHTKEI